MTPTDTAPRAAAAAGYAPKPAFNRQYLRNGLPSVYREGEHRETFAEKFMAALEEVLDPLVAMIELLPAHLDMTIAPDEWVKMAGAWLGVDFDPLLDGPARRRLVIEAPRLARARGTVAGIRHTLELAFPEVPGIGVWDTGGVAHGEEALPDLPPDGPAVWVLCPPGTPPQKRNAIRRTVELLRPVGVRVEMVEAEGVSE